MLCSPPYFQALSIIVSAYFLLSSFFNEKGLSHPIFHRQLDVAIHFLLGHYIASPCIAYRISSHLGCQNGTVVIMGLHPFSSFSHNSSNLTLQHPSGAFKTSVLSRFIIFNLVSLNASWSDFVRFSSLRCICPSRPIRKPVFIHSWRFSPLISFYQVILLDLQVNI